MKNWIKAFIIALLGLAAGVALLLFVVCMFVLHGDIMIMAILVIIGISLFCWSVVDIHRCIEKREELKRIEKEQEYVMTGIYNYPHQNDEMEKDND